MKITGIISEYNPFHHGHRYHIDETRKLTDCDVLINVMSGNFVQRGEPAIIDKWKRAKAAIEQGCDLVLELPYTYAVQSSDHFAYGAIETLKLAQIDALVFGSESNDIAQLKHYAKTPYECYKAQQTSGISLSKAMEKVHTRMPSNDILGISYLKALINSSITPYTIQRTNGYHDVDITQKICSATAIRKALANKQNITHATPMYDQLQEPHYIQSYYPYLQTLFCTMSKDILKTYFLVDEGIESLFIKQAHLCTDFDTFLNACISKRYARSSIQRTLMHILTQTTKAEMNTLPRLQHIRVLAFNTTGRTYLHHLKKQEACIISSRFNQIPQPYRDIEIRSTYAYAIPCSLKQRKELALAELQPPIYLAI